nr:unnamed protein product [Callosobruchus analis]
MDKPFILRGDSYRILQLITKGKIEGRRGSPQNPSLSKLQNKQRRREVIFCHKKPEGCSAKVLRCGNVRTV